MSDKKHTNLEYNDGLGDMLREKRTGGANLNRSIFVAAGIVLLSVGAFALAFKWGTDLLFKLSPTPAPIVTHSAREKEIEQENKALIKEMEALLARATADVSAPTVSASAPTRGVATVLPTATQKPSVAAASTRTLALRGKPQPQRRDVVPQRVTTPVRSEPRVSAQVAPKTLYRVISGPYLNRGDAATVASKIQAAGYGTFVKADSTGFVVQAGAYSSQAIANDVVTRLGRHGISASISGLN